MISVTCGMEGTKWTEEQNRTGGMEQPGAGSKGRRMGRGTGWKKAKRLAKEHICTAHGHGQPCDDGQGGGPGWRWVSVCAGAGPAAVESMINKNNNK